MIYKHYKGGLYFNIGYAIRLTGEFPAKNIVHVAVASLTETDNLEKADVLMVHDKLTNSAYYAIDKDVEGVYCFYRDLKGNHWLRPREMFFENVEVKDSDGNILNTPRFKKVSGEFLFNTISELAGDKHEV